MKLRAEQLRSLVTRRRAVLAGGGGALAIVAALAASRSTGSRAQALRGIDLAEAKDLGDGFFEADGWILTAEDVRRIGGLPAAKAD